jgi:hypothetical protein
MENQVPTPVSRPGGARCNVDRRADWWPEQAGLDLKLFGP